MPTFLKNILARVSNVRELKKLALAHKLWSGVIAVVILGGGWFAYGALTAPSAAPSYVLGTVTKGTIVSSVSESGQVSSSDSVNLVAQVSGNVTWVGITPGQKVSAGQGLMAIDNTTATQAVATAEATLHTAELQYQQDQAQAPLTYQADLSTLQTAKDDLATAYVNAFNAISTTYLNLANTTTGMNDVLYGHTLDRAGEQWNVDYLTNIFQNDDRVAVKPFAQTAETDYQTANTKYTASLADYQKLTRTSPNTDVDTMLTEAIATQTSIAQALQSDLNFFGKVSNLATTDSLSLPAAEATLLANTTSYLATTNSDLNTLLADKKTIDADQQSVVNAQNAITLYQVGNTTGSNPITLQVSASTLAEDRQNLQNLKDDLAKYTVVAPFSGVISAVSAHVGDSASGTLATIVTNDRIATLSINEVDAAKIKLGDKATLTFDAIDGLTLTGTVAEIDPVGTVSQGVVSYNVQIDFSSQNQSVKPGMTVNAAIQTGVSQDTLIVPSSAVKTLNGQSYVMVFTPPLSGAAGSTVTPSTAPTMVPVTTGLSDNTNVEITSGLTEGEQIVVRTASSGTAVSAATSRTGAGGNRAFGGGGATIIRGL